MTNIKRGFVIDKQIKRKYGKIGKQKTTEEKDKNLFDFFSPSGVKVDVCLDNPPKYKDAKNLIGAVKNYVQKTFSEC